MRCRRSLCLATYGHPITLLPMVPIMTTTIDKYLVQIQDATQPDGIYAYRGQQDSEWLLHSAATRRLIDEHDRDIVRDPDFPQLYINYHRETLIEPARTRGFGSVSGRRLSDLEVLAKLQHFGAPTGLLDFSWSPLIALWFACEDPCRDGKLFVVNTNDPIRVSRVISDEAAQELTAVFLGAAGPPHQSYWEPMVSGDASARILRQRSVFIIGRPLLPVDPDILSEIVVAKEDKEALRLELQTLDFHQESLFQDVYGFAQATNRRPAPPLTPQAYQRLGNRHYQRGEYTDAVVAYNKAIELAPNVGLAYLLRGNVNAACGLHQEAIRDYDKAVANVDQLARIAQDTVFFNRGNSKAELSDYHGALQDYAEAISRNPNFPQAYYNRGNTYLELYRFEQAIADYEQGTGHRSQQPFANKGIALIALGRLQEARRGYLESVAKGGDHSKFAQNLWTLEQIMLVLDDLGYTVRAVPDPDTNAMCLRFQVAGGAREAGQNLGRFVFRGRDGNVGNTGGPGLSGGRGSSGKPAIRVYVDVRHEDQKTN